MFKNESLAPLKLCYLLCSFFFVLGGKKKQKKLPLYISPDRRLWTQCNAKLYAVL